MKNYNDIVSKAREGARDFLRMRWINAVRQNIMHMKSSHKSVLDAIEETRTNYAHHIETLEKAVARANYAISKLDPADPDYETKKKGEEDSIESYNAKLVELKTQDPNAKLDQDVVQENAAYETELKALNKKIEDISKGEKKVSADDLEDETVKILREITKTACTEACNFEDCAPCEAGDLGTEVDETPSSDSTNSEDVEF